MRIGIITQFEKPTNNFRLIQLLAQTQGIEVFYFNQKDVDVQTKTINAWFAVDGSSFTNAIQKEVAFPEIIDDSHLYGGWKDNAVRNELSKSSLLLRIALGNKRNIINAVKKSIFSDMAITTYNYKDKNIDDLLAEHSKLIIKPNFSGEQIKIASVTKEKNMYVVAMGKKVRKLTREEFFAEFDEVYRTKEYIVQPHLNFRTKNGSPFAIRLTVIRGTGGKWVNLRPQIRVGRIDGIKASIEDGGYLITDNYENFLVSEFGENGTRIAREISNILSALPSVIQKEFKKAIPAIGIDIGIDRDNGAVVKFIEANDCPSIYFAEYLDARERINYYKYLLSNYEKLTQKKQTHA